MDAAEKSRRIRFVLHKTRRILLLDFTGLANMEDALEVIAFARQTVAGQPLNSLYTLSDITDSRYDRDVTAALQDLAKHNKPYVIAGAAVGVSGLQKVVFRSILAFSSSSRSSSRSRSSDFDLNSAWSR